jgi:squalene synthase HpnC
VALRGSTGSHAPPAPDEDLMSVASRAAALATRDAPLEEPVLPAAALERARAENFPVALRLLPARPRAHLLAIYGFARLCDDLGDEADGDRLALLDALERELERAFAGTARHPTLTRLAASLREVPLPAEPFRKLIEAGRRDQRISRHPTWADLRTSCAFSADPVGELVLHVFAAATPQRLRRSASVCTALQVVEHCQDVAEDLARDRIYLPTEDLARHGCDERALASPAASPALRRAIALQVERAAALLDDGEPLVASLRGPARLAVAGFVAGGRAVVDALRRIDCDVLAHPAPRPRRRDVARHALVLLARAARGRGGEGATQETR